MADKRNDNDPQIAALAKVGCEEAYPYEEYGPHSQSFMGTLEEQIMEDEDNYGWEACA
jgi:hypothetical protein